MSCQFILVDSNAKFFEKTRSFLGPRNNTNIQAFPLSRSLPPRFRAQWTCFGFPLPLIFLSKTFPTHILPHLANVKQVHRLDQPFPLPSISVPFFQISKDNIPIFNS